MIQKHRESRAKSSMTPGSHKESRHRHSDNPAYPFILPSSRSMDDSSDFIKYSRVHRSKRCSHSHKVCPPPLNLSPSGKLKRIPTTQCDPSHGLKRTGNFSWDGDSQNAAKQPHLDRHSTEMMKSVSASNSNMAESSSGIDVGAQINLWPPFCISITPGITTPSYR